MSTSTKVLGYWETENIIVPTGNGLTLQEFEKKYPGRTPVLASQLQNDDDFTGSSDEDEDEEF